MDGKQFNDWLRESAPEFADLIAKENTGRVLDKALGKNLTVGSAQEFADLLGKNLTVGDVHVAGAGGTGGKRKKKKPEPPVSVSYEQKSFDEAGSADKTFDYYVRGISRQSAVDKLKLKIDPEELKTLLAANPALKDALAALIVGGGGAAVVGKADNWEMTVMRHGATHLNDNDTSVDRVRGWKDVPLSDKGKKEAQKLAEKVAKDGGLDYIASSDLKRASDTAAMVAKACGLKKVDWVTEGLRPWNVGDYAGKSSKEAVPILAQYAVETPDKAVPGGESFNDFKNRFTKTLVTIRDKAGTKKAGIVTHHRGERLLKALESNDWNGEIDAKEFTKKGETTAGYEAMTIPMDKMRQIAAQEVAKWFNADLDYSALWQGPDMEKAWSDEAREAAALARQHGAARDRHMRAIVRGATGRAQQMHADAAHLHETAAEHFGDAERSYSAGNPREGAYSMGQGREFGRMGNYASSKVGDRMKRDGEVDKSFALNITKVDAEQQIFYGWAYVSEENGQIVVDKQDDYILPEDLLKAAEEFTLHGGGLGDMHDARNVGRVVASFVTTQELCDAFGLRPDNNRRGWILGFKVDDADVWKKIKSGSQLELSIGGRGQRVEDEN